MKKTTLILVRHAESAPDSEIPESDWPLSELGRTQAQALVGEIQVDRIYSSPYPRAVHTLLPVAEHLGLSVETMDDLRERRLAGRMLDNWLEALQNAWADFDRCLPGGESSRTCQNRVSEAMRDIAIANEGKVVAVASHGNALALFLNSIDGSFGFKEWQQMQNPHVFRVQFSNGTWSLLTT